ncbi:GNAT family N-acetyltransferase [Pseudoxanthomonas winnipegensis]|uniref:GNAT family N-acetyltransferase n=1 Tax=Pseudoxanthomonas winnipegensis TaxID=2480810 RepID=UPI0030F393C5
MTEKKFEIVEGFERTSKWLEDVCNASDSHRNELGFLARSVFVQFARRNDLYVLLSNNKDGEQYAGHLLFDRRFPRAHVRQMFVLAKYRRSGAATLLLDHLRHALTQSSFISLYARVAEDMVEANKFWQRQSFYVQRSVKGGASKNRQILVRCRELDSPQLFPTSGLSDNNPLGLLETATAAVPLYLLDLNVLFDVQPRRLRRHEIVGLLQAERMNFCRLAVSSEVREELERTLSVRQTDPMAAYVDTFASFPVGRIGEGDRLFDELADLIFPSEARSGRLSANQKSDIRHVVTVMKHDLAGLVTNDEAILAVASDIESRYSIQVLSSSAFEVDDATARSDESFEGVETETLKLLSVTPELEQEVRNLLTKKMQMSGSHAATWLPFKTMGNIAFRFGVWSEDSCVGYITWPALVSPGKIALVRAAIDESHAQAIRAARILLLNLIDRLRAGGPRQVQVELLEDQSHIREVGAVMGFVGAAQGKSLVKFMLGELVTPANWAHCHAVLVQKGGPRLPEQAPAYSHPDQQIICHTPDGNRIHIPLDRLESLLAPTLFCLPGRPAVLTPVQRRFAEPLLGHSQQASLLPQGSASQFADRLYFSKASTLKHFKRGSLIFFYESSKGKGGRQVVAVARVREAYLKPCDTLKVSDLQQSALTKDSMKEIGRSPVKTVTVFDNIFPFPNPVGLAVLRRLGCGRPNDLITTHPISEAQVRAILNEGFGHG